MDLTIQDPPCPNQINIRTCASARKEGVEVPKVHGHDKAMDPHKRPEQQPHIAHPTLVAPLPQPTLPTPPVPTVNLPPKPHRTSRLPAPPMATTLCKTTTAQVASRKLIECSIHRLNRPKAPAHLVPVPPPVVPLIPQFDPLDKITPPPAIPVQPPVVNPAPVTGPNTIQPPVVNPAPVTGPNTIQPQIRPPNLPAVTPAPLTTRKPLPLMRPTPQTQQVDSTPIFPEGDQIYYSPSHNLTDPKAHSGRIRIDPQIDLGIPNHNLKDLIDLVVRAPNIEDTELSVPLSELVDVRKLAPHDLPRQDRLDPLLKLIEHKILHQLHLSASFRDMHGAYLHSPHFCDIYLYLLQNKVPHNPQK